MSNPVNTPARLRELAQEVRTNAGAREQIAEGFELIAQHLAAKPAPAPAPAKTTSKKSA